MATAVLSQKLMSEYDAGKQASTNKLRIPSYDRTRLKAGVLHLGVGNFHRSHFAAYMNDLFTTSLDDNMDWGIVGAGIMHFDDAKRTLLQSQDWLQTLVEQDAKSSQGSVIGSMIDFLPVDFERKEHKALQDMLVNPSIKIVSLTVTEGGYYLSDGKFNVDAPDMQHDIEHPEAPHSIFGMVVKALAKRRAANIPPFTVMSCDNIPENGHITKSVVVGLAQAMMGDDMAQWVRQNVAFPNSMVDRITPGSTAATRAFVQTNYGYDDQAPIFCEPFRQWVLEDKFSAGRPAFDLLENVKIVPDVLPYEIMKLRILNGGHASMCYPSALLGLQYIHEGMEHPTISAFLDTLERQEIIPTVPPVPDTNLQDYWKTIAGRFSNPVLQDTLGRNCYDGASRQPKFIVPTIRDALLAGRSVDGLALVSALWCHYCNGVAADGSTIAPNDPQWDRLQALARRAHKEDATVWLTELNEVYGTDIGESPIFQAAFTQALSNIQTMGVEGALQAYVGSR
jgi:mannitol 2-dehydrogenase